MSVPSALCHREKWLWHDLECTPRTEKKDLVEVKVKGTVIMLPIRLLKSRRLRGQDLSRNPSKVSFLDFWCGALCPSLTWIISSKPIRKRTPDDKYPRIMLSIHLPHWSEWQSISCWQGEGHLTELPCGHWIFFFFYYTWLKVLSVDVISNISHSWWTSVNTQSLRGFTDFVWRETPSFVSSQYVSQPLDERVPHWRADKTL